MYLNGMKSDGLFKLWRVVVDLMKKNIPMDLVFQSIAGTEKANQQRCLHGGRLKTQEFRKLRISRAKRMMRL